MSSENKKFDFTIENLGECKIKSPIELSTVVGNGTANYVKDSSFVRTAVNVYDTSKNDPLDSSNLMQKAGPREYIYFSPDEVKAGICTCGGLCPGLNDVIRAVVRCLWNRYGVRDIRGFQFGYKGFFKDENYETIPLNPENVDEIHKIGGSYLGTSRGGGMRTKDIVDTLQEKGINMLFVIGGDGTQHGALAISEEVEKRGYKCSVIGIPKTVDNDFLFIDRSFGFETAVQQAKDAVASIHMEARSQINGIGLVKLMGRESGFIATAAALASHECNFCLIPEVPFEMEGPNGFLSHLEKRLEKRHHAVIIVAEGAGQELLTKTNQTDASGNIKLADIGVFLRDQINAYFKKKNIEINLKYIDPGYQIRAAVTTASDSIYCERLGNNAVHAAMAGKTKMVVGLVHEKFVHIPINMVIASRNVVDPEGALWRDTLDATSQPILMVNDIQAAKEKMLKNCKR
ncbi:MAG: ATP-dependent 6-phosphofructokinase [Spirochaetia bacterium]|nr:ATP-dependent 6-phosphofructokinase [Spirochaetia bacterium]MDD5776487.1 ATP-dependent 6-phosphofructokinase [Treponema sp.]MCI6825963.1 ATP-dependent 6-phosphofructokinase [Spirochaetia bacterium]MCI7564671.1 ATP-dependent 6-phosphofructokinase [Spirochaetia bacterium]MCI7799689.1 ATP-dependent 6-phosphofructokinase [Spirochaetia bacterium]